MANFRPIFGCFMFYPIEASPFFYILFLKKNGTGAQAVLFQSQSLGFTPRKNKVAMEITIFLTGNTSSCMIDFPASQVSFRGCSLGCLFQSNCQYIVTTRMA